MKKAVIHFVQHSCGPQECDCSPRCHAREGDEIVTSSSVAAVTCKNCLRGLKKDLHPDLPKSKTVAEERDQLKAENEALRKIISESATACGAAVSVECSLEFMAMLPGEIASVIGKLRQECAARHPFRPALDQPLIGYTGCVICGQYTDHQGLPCPNKRAFAMSKGAGHD